MKVNIEFYYYCCRTAIKNLWNQNSCSALDWTAPNLMFNYCFHYMVNRNVCRVCSYLVCVFVTVPVVPLATSLDWLTIPRPLFSHCCSFRFNWLGEWKESSAICWTRGLLRPLWYQITRTYLASYVLAILHGESVTWHRLHNTTSTQSQVSRPSQVNGVSSLFFSVVNEKSLTTIV